MSGTTDNQKQELRCRLRKARIAMPLEDRDAADGGIEGLLVALPEYREASVILTYLSFGAEVETRGLIGRAWADGKVVTLPRCVPGTREMRWFEVDDLDHLMRSPFGVEEPVPDPARELDLGTGARVLAIVPGLSFDATGHRLGYGGGYYDRFLAGFAGASVGLCREHLLAAPGELPLDEHDLPVDMVVTERRVLRTSRPS